MCTKLIEIRIKWTNWEMRIYTYIYVYLEWKNLLHVKQCVFYVLMSMIVNLD